MLNSKHSSLTHLYLHGVEILHMLCFTLSIHDFVHIKWHINSSFLCKMHWNYELPTFIYALTKYFHHICFEKKKQKNMHGFHWISLKIRWWGSLDAQWQQLSANVHFPLLISGRKREEQSTSQLPNIARCISVHKYFNLYKPGIDISR